MKHGNPSVLVVDDDMDTCRNLSDILTDLGYHVDSAHEGLSALDLVRQNSYDVALLDLKMPGMDGLTLYREIKKIRADTVAIIVSAYVGSDITQEALEAGAWQILSKPVDFPKLLGLVGQVIDQPLVLVIDDDPDLCVNLWDLLRERGYRVALAHTQSEADRNLHTTRFHVVLIDMKLPGGDGTTMFRLVRQANPNARTLLITGHRIEMDPMIQQVLDEGADAVCYKPFDVPGLLAMLQQLTEGQPGRAIKS